MLDLRILGVAREIPLAPLKRLFRVMWIGFGINAFTGVLLIIAYPTKALTNPVFYLKLTFIGLAIWIITMLRDRVFYGSVDEPAMMARGATLAKWSLGVGVVMTPSPSSRSALNAALAAATMSAKLPAAASALRIVLQPAQTDTSLAIDGERRPSQRYSPISGARPG